MKYWEPTNLHCGLRCKSLFLSMKLTTALLLIACLQVAAGGNAQAITLSLRNVPIVQAFTAIEKQSPYSFIYIREDIQKASTVSIEITNGTIESVLELCFRQQPFTYSMIGYIQ